jgi:hypothetical protein
MIELRPGSPAPSIRRLYPTSGHTWRRAFAVLDGRSRGRILSEDLTNPTWAAVQEYSDDSVLYLAGTLTRELVADLIEGLRRDRIVTVGFVEDDPLLDVLPSDPDFSGGDIDFEDRNPAIDLEPFIRLPEGLRLARIDADLAPRCIWGPWMTASVESSVTDGLGYCLLDGERVISEAFAGPIVDGALEMATITDDAYQRRGLATIVCARTILECERLGYATWWNTGLTNLASAGLARKLGYRIERQYRVMAWLPASRRRTPVTV